MDEQLNMKDAGKAAQQRAEFEQRMTRAAASMSVGGYSLNRDFDEPDADGVIGVVEGSYSSLEYARQMGRWYPRMHGVKFNVTDDETGEILFEYDAQGNETVVEST